MNTHDASVTVVRACARVCVCVCVLKMNSHTHTIGA